MESKNKGRTKRPALTPEARENQMIALAVDLAEKQLIEGTASSQIITHYLKLATTKEQLEKEKLEHENQLLAAKTEALQQSRRSEGFYEDVLRAFKIYSGSEEPSGNDEDIFGDDEF